MDKIGEVFGIYSNKGVKLGEWICTFIGNPILPCHMIAILRFSKQKNYTTQFFFPKEIPKKWQINKSIILLFQKKGGSRLSIRALASMGSIPWAMKPSCTSLRGGSWWRYSRASCSRAESITVSVSIMAARTE